MKLKTTKIKNNIKLLVEKEPVVKESYNLLIVKYWENFEGTNAMQWVNLCTPAESISRAFRSLVRAGEIEVDKATKSARNKEEKEFRKYYQEQKI